MSASGPFPVRDSTTNATQVATAWLPAAFIVATVAWYFAYIHQHAMNVPFADDIYDVVKVLSDVEQAGSVADAFDILYAQHNDHRTISSRLVYGLTLIARGELDFRLLIFLANGALLLILCALYLSARQHPMKYLVLLPAAMVLFQLRFYGIMLWSMAAFAYFYVFLYGFCGLYCLHRVTPGRFAAACLLATLATFTLASGQLAWVMGFVSIVHQCLIRRTAHWRYLLGWSLLALIAWYCWRIGLETPNQPIAMLQRFIADPGYYVLYTLTLTGNAFSESSVAIAAGAGAAMLATLAAVTYATRRHEDKRLELCCWYIALTVVAMTLGRAPYSTIEYALSSRYSFPSVLLLSSLWVLVAVRLKLRDPRLLGVVALLAGVYLFTMYRIYEAPMQQHLTKRIDNFNQGKYWSWPRPMKETNAIVARAIEQGLYRPPDRPLSGLAAPEE
jgi:hypothetical protein